jgi:hypothetical protein
MKPDEYLEHVKKQLAADGAQVSEAQLPSARAVVGYTSKFRWKWLATKLHLFTLAVYAPELNVATYTQIVKEAADYGVQQKGTLRGLQVGVAVNVIIATRALDTETAQLASSRPPKGFAKLATPAVVDIVQAQTYTYTGKIMWGALYTSWLRERLQAALPHIEPRPLTEEDLAEMY